MTAVIAPKRPPALPREVLGEIIRLALAEDIGSGDITTALTVDNCAMASARLVFHERGVAAGGQVARAVFETLDPNLAWRDIAEDGSEIPAGSAMAEMDGRAAAILTAERVALNLLQRMSGIATVTRAYVQAVSHTRATILDTRKTMPGLRLLDKYAVVCGGGTNHRFGLYDAVLIKDNHIAAAGGIRAALNKVQTHQRNNLEIEIEVDRLDQIEDAIAGGAHIILLDNMDIPALRLAVKAVAGRARTEASGGVTLESVSAIAEAGVDFISVGRLTHSSPALDIGLDLELAPS